VSSPPEENEHWNTKWRRTTSCAGKKPAADLKKDLYNLEAGRKSRKQPTPFVGIKPNGKCQLDGKENREEESVTTVGKKPNGEFQFYFMKPNYVRLNHSFPKLCAVAFLTGFLWPAVARAQDSYYLQYQLHIDNGPDVRASSDSGQVQSTNLLTTTFGSIETYSTSTMTPVAAFGNLQLSAYCSADRPVGDGNSEGGDFGSAVGGGSDVFFADTIYPTYTNLPAGSKAYYQVVTIYQGSVGIAGGEDPANAAYNTGSASVSLLANGSVTAVLPANTPNPAVGGIGSSLQTNMLSWTIVTQVGAPFVQFKINPAIQAAGGSSTGNDVPFSGSVSIGVAAQTYLTPLTPGAGYTSASGTIYPTLSLPAPSLTITPVANQSVLVSWPAVYATYVLQQNPALAAAGWLQNSNTISAVNGTNQVTINNATNSLFFRLAQP
jgi:hypothetical protein